MAAAIRGYGMILVMPENQSVERRQTMRAFGARAVVTDAEGEWDKVGAGWRSACATRSRGDPRPVCQSRTIQALNEVPAPRSGERRPAAQITLHQQHGDHRHHHGGVHLSPSRVTRTSHHRLPADGKTRRSPVSANGRRPTTIYDKSRVDQLEYVAQADAEEMTRRLAGGGIFAGISSVAPCTWRFALPSRSNAVIVSIVCDRPVTATCPVSFPPDRGMPTTLVFDIETIPGSEGIRSLRPASGPG